MSSSGTAAGRDRVLGVEGDAAAASANDPLDACPGGDGLTCGLPFAHAPLMAGDDAVAGQGASGDGEANGDGADKLLCGRLPLEMLLRKPSS